MTNPKSYTGCWTCRLRHKKCDESLPVCGSCKSLEISCYYDYSKPGWMDNGERQHEMAQQVKAEVKRSASRRRGRRRIQSIARDLGDSESGLLFQPGPFSANSSALFDDTSSSILSPSSSKTTADNSRVDSISQGRLRVSCFPSASTATSNQSSTAPDDSSANSPAQGRPSYSTAQDMGLTSLPFQKELELGFIMTYLDYVFPVLFPFYRPSMLEGGRSWLLALLMKNKGLCHTVISLTSYFFSIVPIMSGPAHQLCASKTWEELQKQADLAIKIVQHNLRDVSRRGIHSDLQESAYLMESIVQLLGFEVIVARTENWQMHLDAAIVLFEQIFQYHSTNEPPPNISAILAQMGQRSFVINTSSPPLWNTDQAAFRFFSAILLVDDIISSTSLEQPPRLREYHPYLLTNDLKPDQEVPLQLEDFIGCQSWALLLVGEIAALDAWKKVMKKGGTLSMAQMVQRASVIERGLHEGLAR
ncbi:fungal-specific transcription factor domain-containing protein, partial [Bisporella sp. PMI_857]